MPSPGRSTQGQCQRITMHEIFPSILQPKVSGPLAGIFENNQIKEFKALTGEIGVSTENLEDLLKYEMARVVYGSNYVERVGISFEDTMGLCGRILRGEEFQDLMDMSRYEYNSYLEVINHSKAFIYILNKFVIQHQPLTENLIKETHALLCQNLSASDAGVLSSKSWGGVYRSISGNEKAFAGAFEFTKPSEIPKAMKSMVSRLQNDIENMKNPPETKTEKRIEEICQLAAKYCERFVQIHPFRDGNGRMCRLILNAILIRFIGVPVSIGMNEDERDAYLSNAQESSKVGGDPAGLGEIVYQNMVKTLGMWKQALVKVEKYQGFKRNENALGEIEGAMV